MWIPDAVYFRSVRMHVCMHARMYASLRMCMYICLCFMCVNIYMFI